MRLASALLLASCLLSCQKSDAQKTVPPPVVPAVPQPNTEAQPKLPVIRLFIGAAEMETEQAIRPEHRERGMMFRKTMGENEAMLFVFEQPQRVGFWMKNTTVPMSAAYIDSAGKVLEIHPLKPLDENSAQSVSDRIQYVLEVPQGWFDRRQIKPGALIRTERGTLQETYFGKR